MYSAVLKNTIIPIGEIVSGFHVQKYLKELETTQWWSPSDIRELQNEKFRNLIKHTYESVPYYYEMFRQLKLTPSDFKSTDDIQKLPILDKETIKRNFPDKIVSSNVDLKTLISGFSSGSTGEPFQYMMSKKEKTLKWASFFRFWKWAGYDFGMKYVNLTGYPHFAFKKSKFLSTVEGKLMRVLPLLPFEMNQRNITDYIRKIFDFNPEIIRGYTSSITYLAKYLEEHQLYMNLLAVLVTGETLTEAQRRLIERVFNCKIFNGYGGEGMEIFAECERHEGMHVNDENIFVEIIRDNERVFTGTVGRIVLTNLNNYAMPFIRYDIKDAASFSSRKCSCGRGLTLVKNMEGRLADILVTSNGKILVVHFFTGLFEFVQEVKNFQVVQSSLNEITIRIVKEKTYCLRNEKYILKEIQRYVGDEVKLNLQYVEEIEKTRTGKRRLFISQIKKNESMVLW